MTTQKYTVQHIGHPTASKIDEREWKTYSTHNTESAAWKSVEKATAHWENGSWDDHYRVIAPDGTHCDRREYYFLREMKSYAK